MIKLAVQYLEDGPGIAEITPDQARERLREAFARLPLSYVLLGWHLREDVMQACAEETARNGAQLYRWHPLLTGDGVLAPLTAWQTVGLDGTRVPGFQSMPEFTFVCPNRPAVREAVMARLRLLCRSGAYQGMFLDRIRFPSPAVAPDRALACFCDDCVRVAADEDLDLLQVRTAIRTMLQKRGNSCSFVRTLLDPAVQEEGPGLASLRQFLAFRARSVTRFVVDAAALVHDEGLEVGLDCFSPALTWMVGQDLGALDDCCEWVKTMSYAHVLGPAGLPFELLRLADWLVDQGMDQGAALACLGAASRLPLPADRTALHVRGLSPEALALETQRARDGGVHELLVGIELVDIPGVTQIDDGQIDADLNAITNVGADGLVLSWDLWHMPLHRLDIVGRDRNQ
jgi:hypothetical protein